MIEKLIFKGTEAIKFENDILRVLVLPTIGGKIASIYHKNKDFELLFQNKEDTYIKAKIYDDFSKFDASGFDDAFPTINKCVVRYDNKDVLYPDHGEVWSASFNYKVVRDALKLWFDSAILPYRYEKNISVDGEKLNIHYNIKNNGREAFPCIWAMHCLINCEEDMEVNFPDGTQNVVNVQKSKRLGAVDTVHSYPVTKDINGEEYRLDRVLPLSSNNTEKYYVNGKVINGYCNVYYPSKNVKFLVEFDNEKLPYLGFWVTEGGFRGDYNCAFEPTNGFYDSIDIAKNKNRLFYLEGGKELDFYIKISLK